MIVRARTVVTMDGAPIENGAVAISGNQIADVGKFDEIRTRNAGEIVDLGEQVLLPGLINAPIRTWWFAELIDVRAPDRASEIVDLAIESLKSAHNWGLAPHALFTASKDLYRRCEKIARRENILLTTHLAESGEEMKMFRDASGPLYEFLKSIGRDMSDCGRQTPLELFIGAPGGRALPHWIVSHLNELTESDFDLLERLERRFHVVHSPRSHDYFNHSRFRFEKLHALGFNICLGTDSLASNENVSLFAEMRAFQRCERGISPREILKLITVNPARALHQENTLGGIRPGFRADLIALPCKQPRNTFEEIMAFDGTIDWMIMNGDVTRSSERGGSP